MLGTIDLEFTHAHKETNGTHTLVTMYFIISIPGEFFIFLPSRYQDYANQELFHYIPALSGAITGIMEFAIQP